MKVGTLHHPKTARLAKLLEIPLYATVGVLEAVWHLAAANADEGDVGRFSNPEIAVYIGWTGDADQLIEALVETMHANQGVGLAAPQVGILEQIFVVDVGQGPLIFVNPRIIKKTGSDILEEGCLSLPGVLVKIKRPNHIKVQYIDENNRPQESEFNDLLARVVQHETDHINGKLISDYASASEKRKLKDKFKALEEQNIRPF